MFMVGYAKQTRYNGEIDCDANGRRHVVCVNNAGAGGLFTNMGVTRGIHGFAVNQFSLIVAGCLRGGH